MWIESKLLSVIQTECVTLPVFLKYLFDSKLFNHTYAMPHLTCHIVSCLSLL